MVAIGYVVGEPLEVLDIVYGVDDRIVVKETDTGKTHNIKIYYTGDTPYFILFNRKISFNNVVRF